MLICVGLAIVVILTVASPSFREGDKLLTPEGEEQVQAIRRKAATFSHGAEHRLKSAVRRERPEHEAAEAAAVVATSQADPAAPAEANIDWTEEDLDDEWSRPESFTFAGAATDDTDPDDHTDPDETDPDQPDPDETDPDDTDADDDPGAAEPGAAEPGAAEREAAGGGQADPGPTVVDLTKTQPRQLNQSQAIQAAASPAGAGVAAGVAARMQGLMQKARAATGSATEVTEPEVRVETSPRPEPVAVRELPEPAAAQDSQAEIPPQQAEAPAARAKHPEPGGEQPAEQVQAGAQDDPAGEVTNQATPRPKRGNPLTTWASIVEHAGADTGRIGPRHAKP